MEKRGYINALDLAGYIAQKYKEKFKTDISNIKLQKSLYFLFAYWGGFVRRTKELQETGQIESGNINLDEYLFSNRIEAWVYGPVVADVYHHFNPQAFDLKKVNEKIEKLPPEVLAFVNDMLEDLFSTSDFKLVDISHMDNCWKNNYFETEERHNREIPKEEIINEYSRK